MPLNRISPISALMTFPAIISSAKSVAPVRPVFGSIAVSTREGDCQRAPSKISCVPYATANSAPILTGADSRCEACAFQSQRWNCSPHSNRVYQHRDRAQALGEDDLAQSFVETEHEQIGETKGEARGKQPQCGSNGMRKCNRADQGLHHHLPE